MHKIFISYHHANDQDYKEKLIQLNKENPIFIDGSIDTGDISDDLDDQAIRQKIRDEYLKDSTVTILLVGTQTMHRKHVDWELYSSMIDGKLNKRSAIIVISLPSTGCRYYTAAYGDEEKTALYPKTISWKMITSRSEYENRYPYLPPRITDNLLNNKSKVSVTTWDIIEKNWIALEFLIDAAFNDRANCEYDLSRSMRRNNS